MTSSEHATVATVSGRTSGLTKGVRSAGVPLVIVVVVAAEQSHRVSSRCGWGRLLLQQPGEGGNGVAGMGVLGRQRGQQAVDPLPHGWCVAAQHDALHQGRVLGRHGRGASDEDIKLFADALADNLMQRYGSSLLDFNTQLRVRVKSERPLAQGQGVKVSSEFLRQGGAPIPVDYLMRRNGNQWKVFDVMVEGVSYVQTFRNQFDTELQRKSIKQVAEELRQGQLSANAGQ